MAGKVFFSVSMSLDGYIAPGSLGGLMGQQWMELQSRIFPLRYSPLDSQHVLPAAILHDRGRPLVGHTSTTP